MPQLWKSPEYRFRVPVRGNATRLQEIVIDVTLSAPSFDQPSNAMKGVLTKTIRETVSERLRVLDFGAGKLRNALYLLGKGLSVCGVEFERLSNTQAGKKAYAKARRFRRFWTLVYPHEFVKSKSKFDLVLLVNSTATSSCAPQSENQRRSSCQRGDSPSMRPVIRICTLGTEGSFNGITTSSGQGLGIPISNTRMLDPRTSCPRAD